MPSPWKCPSPISAALLLLGAAYLAGCAGSSGSNAALNNATAGYDSTGALATSAAAGSDATAFGPTAASAPQASAAAKEADKLTVVAKAGSSASMIGQRDAREIHV